MSIDTRTSQERAYDMERDGSLYLKPAPQADDCARVWEMIGAIISDPMDDGSLYADTPISDSEAAILELLIAYDECPACEGAGCSECDGSPLTEGEIAEQGA